LDHLHIGERRPLAPLGYANESGLLHMYQQAVADIAAFVHGSPTRAIS
jgi:hypothetical protein